MNLMSNRVHINFIDRIQDVVACFRTQYNSMTNKFFTDIISDYLHCHDNMGHMPKTDVGSVSTPLHYYSNFTVIAICYSTLH